MYTGNYFSVFFKVCSLFVNLQISYGMVLCELFSRIAPFDGLLPRDIMSAVTDHNQRPPLPVCPFVFTRLIQACWNSTLQSYFLFWSSPLKSLTNSKSTQKRCTPTAANVWYDCQDPEPTPWRSFQIPSRSGIPRYQYVIFLPLSLFWPPLPLRAVILISIQLKFSILLHEPQNPPLQFLVHSPPPPQINNPYIDELKNKQTGFSGGYAKTIWANRTDFLMPRTLHVSALQPEFQACSASPTNFTNSTTKRNVKKVKNKNCACVL